MPVSQALVPEILEGGVTEVLVRAGVLLEVEVVVD